MGGVAQKKKDDKKKAPNQKGSPRMPAGGRGDGGGGWMWIGMRLEPLRCGCPRPAALVASHRLREGAPPASRHPRMPAVAAGPHNVSARATAAAAEAVAAAVARAGPRRPALAAQRAILHDRATEP